MTAILVMVQTMATAIAAVTVSYVRKLTGLLMRNISGRTPSK